MVGIFEEETKSEIDPYGPSQAGLNDVIDYNQKMFNRGAYTGDFLAGPDDRYRQAVKDYVGAGAQLGDWGQQQTGIGQDLMSGLGQSQDYFQNAMNGSSFEQNPQKYIDMAGMLSDNPYIDNILNSARGSAEESFRNNVLGPMGGNYAMGGGADSSKYAQQWGQASRGLGRDIYGMEQGFRGDQWNQGLGMAYDTSQQSDRMGMMGAQALNNQGIYGMNTAQQGYMNQMMPSQIEMEAGGMRQGWDQMGLDNAIAKFNAPTAHGVNYQNTAMQPAQAFQTTTQTHSKSPLGGALGIAAQLGAAYMTGGASLAMGGAMGAMGGGGGGGSIGNMDSLFQGLWGTKG